MPNLVPNYEELSKKMTLIGKGKECKGTNGKFGLTLRSPIEIINMLMYFWYSLLGRSFKLGF